MPHAPSPELTKPLEPRLTDDSCPRSQSPQMTREPLASWSAPAWLSGEGYPDRTESAQPHSLLSLPQICSQILWAKLYFTYCTSYWIFRASLVAHCKESACNAGDGGFDPWVRKIPWRRDWQPTPVFLPGESHGRRSLVGYGPWGRRVGHDLATRTARTLHPSPERRPCVSPKCPSSPHKGVFLYFEAFCQNLFLSSGNCLDLHCFCLNFWVKKERKDIC